LRAKFLKENCDSVNAKDISSLFEEIFPELRESEDEKIRKWLIEKVKSGVYPWPNWEDKVISWLDAQKETNLSSQEVKEAAEEFMLTQDTYNSKEEYQIMHAFISGANWKEKQKPVEWSEEDEMFLYNIIKDIEQLKRASKIEQLSDVYDKEISWLKLLKDRMKGE